MTSMTSSIPIHIKSVSTKKANLELTATNFSKISDLKYMIFIEDDDHPTPETQKLIYFGRIPCDHELIESLAGYDHDPTIPLIFHLVIAPPSQPKTSLSPTTAVPLSLHERFIHPQGLVFDNDSLEAAKKWLETTRFEDAGSSYINTRSTVVVAEMMKAHFSHVGSTSQQGDGSQNPAGGAGAGGDAAGPLPLVAQAPVMPRLFQFAPLFRALFVIFITHDMFPSVYWSIGFAFIYYLWSIGLVKYLLQRFYPSLFQPNTPLLPGQPPPPANFQSLFPYLTRVPRSQGAVFDIYTFISTFLFSLYPGWEAT